MISTEKELANYFNYVINLDYVIIEDVIRTFSKIKAKKYKKYVALSVKYIITKKKIWNLFRIPVLCKLVEISFFF